jgi:hypothetical protein
VAVRFAMSRTREGVMATACRTARLVFCPEFVPFMLATEEAR